MDAELRTNLRRGVAAVPLYFIAVGLAHVALAMVFSSRTEGLARDGQAFSGTLVLGVLFVLFGLLMTPFALVLERDSRGLARGAIVAAVLAAIIAGYTAATTAAQGYVTGGTPGVLNCIVEQGRQICPRGDGTWIMDARPDVLVMILALFGAYLAAHIIARHGPWAARTSD